MRCHIAEVSFDLQGSDSKSSAFKEAPGGSSNSGSDAQELSMQLQQVKDQLAESQRNAQTGMDASLQTKAKQPNRAG